MRWMLFLVLLTACAPGPTESAVGFQWAGTGYRSAPARLSVSQGSLVLEGAASPASLRLEAGPVASLEEATGRTVPIRSGTFGLPEGKGLEVLRGTFTLQTVQQGLGRGNFEVTVRPAGGGDESEVRGSFDASL